MLQFGVSAANAYGSTQDVSNGVLGVQLDARPRRTAPALVGLILSGLGFVLSYFGYIWEGVSPNPNELLGSFLFWYGVAYLLLTFPFRDATRGFLSYVRKPFGGGVFSGYLAIHLILYGFLLEAILTTVYGSRALAVVPAFLVSTNVFSPPSLLSTIFDLAYNPSIVVTVPPVFSAALSFYGVSVAAVIAVLVVASIGRTREIGELCSKAKRARSFVALPALGIVFGASCCLSVAGLVSLAVPSASLLTSVIWIYYVTYFLFPCVAVVLLYLNFRSIERISTRLRSSLSQRGSS